MLKNINSVKTKFLISGISILVILPFLILHYFNQPTPEDFFYPGIVKESGFLDAQNYFYKFWGGRISYYALTSYNPLYFYSISGYNVSAFLFFILFFYVLYLFISEFTKSILNQSERLLLLLSVFFLYLYSMPSVGQGFYWLGSVLNYHLPVIIIMLFFISYNRINIYESIGRKTFYTSICFIAAISLAGFNELSAMIFSMSLIFLFLKDYFIEKKINRYLLYMLVLNLFTDYIAFSGPGNKQRSDLYVNSQEFYYSLYNSVEFLFQQLINWIFYSPLLAVTFLLIPVFFKIIKSDKQSLIFSIQPVFPVALLLIFLFTGTFIMLWSNGIVPYGRILNFLFFLFLTGWFYIMIVLLSYFNRKYKFAGYKFPGYTYAVAFLIILALLVKDNNIKTAYSDLISGKAQKFHNDLETRYSKIQNEISDSCIVDGLEEVPESLFFMDIDYVPTTVYNKGYQMYFNKKSIVQQRKVQ